MTPPTTAGRVDQPALHEAVRLISYGLYLVTLARGAEVHALTLNWLSQVSFEPLLVMAALERQSHAHRLLPAAGSFAVNFLSPEQIDLARRSAVPHRLNPHKLAGVPYHLGSTGAPVLDQALGFLECRVTQVLEPGGDHTLFIGAVAAGGVMRAGDPLTLRASRLRYR